MKRVIGMPKHKCLYWSGHHWQADSSLETKLFFLETPSNPLTEIADISALTVIAHDKGILVAVDNCFCTPILQRPLELGADLVVHSATKFL